MGGRLVPKTLSRCQLILSGEPLCLFEQNYHPQCDIHCAVETMMGSDWRPFVVLQQRVLDHLHNSLPRQQYQQNYNLSDNEAFALIYFTNEAQEERNIYSTMNKCMAERNDLAQIENCKPFVFYLTQAVLKLPTLPQLTTFRCVDRSRAQLSDWYNRGEYLMYVAFTSTARRMEDTTTF